MNYIAPKEYFDREIEELRGCSLKPIPHLGIIDATAADDVGNQIYIRNKVKDFNLVGWKVDVYKTDEIEKAVAEALADGCNSLICQLPVREGVAFDAAMIPAQYDADGIADLGIVNSATPRGIIDWLDACGYKFDGKNVVVVGRSKIVGRPMARMLLDRNCTVSVVHSKTKHLDKVKLLERADLVIVAAGCRGVVTRAMCPRAGVVDVGINRDENGKICGDFIEIEEYCDGGWSTPVPGGVGLLTRLGLLKNCMELCELGAEEFLNSFSI